TGRITATAFVAGPVMGGLGGPLGWSPKGFPPEATKAEFINRRIGVSNVDRPPPGGSARVEILRRWSRVGGRERGDDVSARQRPRRAPRPPSRRRRGTG